MGNLTAAQAADLLRVVHEPRSRVGGDEGHRHRHQQLAKCVAAFTDAAGYRAWLKTALRDEVLRRESRRLDEAANTAKAAALAAMESELPAPGPA